MSILETLATNVLVKQLQTLVAKLPAAVQSHVNVAALVQLVMKALATGGNAQTLAADLQANLATILPQAIDQKVALEAIDAIVELVALYKNLKAIDPAL